MSEPRRAWAVKWRSRNRQDGKVEHLIWDGLLPHLFRTRREARWFIEENYAYIRARRDLRAEPHGWRLPVPVRVVLSVVEVES